MATAPRKIAPMKVIRLRTPSRKSAVGLPGRTPGMKLPAFWRFFARSAGLSTRLT
ncbi:hypothetical protein D3C72_2588040 [compost metagenome]